jgi:acyl transferase domain-containing protein
MTKIPPDHFKIISFYNPDGEWLDTLNVRGGHFLQTDITKFDGALFSICRTETESLDPQQRGLLEYTYRVFENAGISLQEEAGTKTEVYVGSFAKEYDVIFSNDPSLQPYVSSLRNRIGHALKLIELVL